MQHSFIERPEKPDFVPRNKKKSRSKENMTFGLGLQRLRYSYGIFKQETLAEAIGWEKHQIRDRECGYAAISLPNIEVISAAFDKPPIEVYKAVTERIDILAPSKDFKNEYSYFKLENSTVKDTFLYDIEDGIRKPFDLVTKVLSPEDITDVMKRQGKALMGARIREGFSSQWMVAYNIGYNPSWVQHRESGHTPIKVEEVLEIANRWGIPHLQLAETLLSPVLVTKEDLHLFRQKYC